MTRPRVADYFAAIRARMEELRPEAHRRAARLLPDCTLVEFPDSKHEPFLERDAIRNSWFAEIDHFIAERLARTSRG